MNEFRKDVSEDDFLNTVLELEELVQAEFYEIETIGIKIDKFWRKLEGSAIIKPKQQTGSSVR